MRFSAIEIGTNSIKMIVMEEREGNSFKTLLYRSTVNRLSNNMFERNVINDKAMEISMEIIKEYIIETERYKSELVSIFSTCVLRDADNSDEFIQKVKIAFGYDINVISGSQEALYAYRASSCLAGKDDEEFAVIDIGGGSTEIIIGTKNLITYKTSIDIGAVRLTETFVKNDPITGSETEIISRHIKEKLKDLSPLRHLYKTRFIGTGGTIKTFAKIYSGSDYGDEEKIHGTVMTKDTINDISNRLLEKDLENRRKIPGLDPKRADVIIAGAILLMVLMEFFNKDEITISSKGVIEGFMLDYITAKDRRS